MPKRGGDTTDMSAIKLLHAADLHLDSPFEALPAGKAAIRRREQRELLDALARLAASERVDLVLLSGDLLDSSSTYFETGESLIQALRSIPAAVFIAPGNHDFYSPKSPYARLQMPENVHIFTERSMRCLCPTAPTTPSQRRSWSAAAWITWPWDTSTRPAA